MLYSLKPNISATRQIAKPFLNPQSGQVHFQGKVEKDPSLVTYRMDRNEPLGETYRYLEQMQAYFQPLFEWVEKSTHNSIQLKWHTSSNSSNEAVEYLTLQVPKSDALGENKLQSIDFLSYRVLHNHSWLKTSDKVVADLPAAKHLIEYMKFWISFFAPHLSESHKLEEGAKEV